MTRKDYTLDLIHEVQTWEGITVEPHRFGGREITLGKVEVGHIHFGGMLDIPYTKRLREQLVAEGKTSLHHLLQDSGWTTFYIRTPEDLAQGIWLLRVSYLHKRLSRLKRDQSADLTPLLAELDALQVSADVRQILL